MSEKEAFTNCKSKFNSMSLKAILKEYFENCTVNRDTNVVLKKESR